jgi:hypothetical protein
MAFTVQYGSYTHETGELGFSVSRSSIRNAGQGLYGVQETWAFKGFLLGTSSQDLTAKMRAMDDAYGRDYQNMTIRDAQNQASFHDLPGETALGGLRVTKRPSFPEYQGAEYVNYRTYEIEVVCKIPASNASNIFSWTESLSWSGTGGPVFVFRRPLYGPCQRQRVATHSTVHATQSGEAVGVFGFPTIPDPIWPWCEHQDRRKLGEVSPKRDGMALVEWKRSWTYEFENDGPLFGIPNLWLL